MALANHRKSPHHAHFELTLLYSPQCQHCFVDPDTEIRLKMREKKNIIKLKMQEKDENKEQKCLENQKFEKISKNSLNFITKKKNYVTF